MSILDQEINKARINDEMAMMARAAKAALARYSAGFVAVESVDHTFDNRVVRNVCGFAGISHGRRETKLVLITEDAKITIES